jgi:glycosyltransferase involved in cell wall biosynthesis
MWLLLAQGDRLLTGARAAWAASRRREAPPPARVVDFRTFLDGKEKGRALLSFDSNTLLEDARRGRSAYFNPRGASLEIARALNQCGYVVDSVSHRDDSFAPEREYDLFIGHDGVSFRRISGMLGRQTKRVTYVTGCYGEAFAAETEKAYSRFCRSRGLDRLSLKACRSIDASNFAVSSADLVVCLGKETRKTFLPVAKKVAAINNAAYLDPNTAPEQFVRRVATSNFVYYGGSGNIQKGVDLLIEAFAGLPEAHLYVFGPLEPEVVRAYARELRSPNIHFVHHWRFVSKLVRRLVSSCTFIVLCGFATGQSTALIAGLGLGLVPVVNTEADIGAPGIAITETSVPGVRDAVRRALTLPYSEIAALGRRAIQSYNQLYKPECYCASFRDIIRQVTMSDTT